MITDRHIEELRHDLQSDDCRRVAEAAAELVAAGEHVEAAALERAKRCLIPRHGGRRRIGFARAYLHLLDPHDGGREAERLLRTDTDPEIRSEAFHALVDYGDEAIPVLRDLLNSRDTTVRWYAYRAAHRIGGPGGLSVLLAGLQDQDTAARLAAANALRYWRDEAFIPLLHEIACRAPSAGFHSAARMVMRRVAPEEAREAIAPLLESLSDRWSTYHSGFIARRLLDELTAPRRPGAA